MIIVPLGHNARTPRRWPWVTICIIATNLVLYFAFNYLDQKHDQLMAERGLTAIVYFHQHPYLALKSPLGDLIEQTPDESGHQRSEQNNANHDSPVGASSALSMVTGEVLREQQAELDSRVGAFAQVAAMWRTTTLGYVPQDGPAWGLITYQFMHGGWMHLLCNVVFLWLAGWALEHTWGRGFFAVFYLTSGVVAALAHKLLAWHSVVPLIGASGAIAGLLGACAWRQAKFRIRPFAFALTRGRVWYLPVYLLLTAWFLVELAQSILSVRHGAGVAHFAHAGGFVFGFFAAWLLRKGRLENSWASPEIYMRDGT